MAPFTSILAALLAAAACTTRPQAEALRPAAAESIVPRPHAFESPEARILEVLARGEIEKVSKGSGGRSLAFKLKFPGGIAGYFKPEQTFGANWYSEVVSYHLDRELGLGRVAPAIGRRIAWKLLAPAAGKDERLGEVVIRKGHVRGSVVYWLEDPLTPVELPAGWESWLRLDTRHEVSPFQDLARYRRARQRGAVAVAAPPIDPRRAGELSDLVVFDYLIGNLDRWSRDLTNVRTMGPERRLIFLDNANGFEVRQKPSYVLAQRLKAVQRFRKTTIKAVRALDRDELVARMSSDPLAPLLNDAQLDQLEERRSRLLEHVAALEEAYGSRVVSF
jgi:hypothetical protein